MVVPGRHDADLNHRVDRKDLDDVGHHPGKRWACHRAPRAGLEQQRPDRIGDRERELRLANIDRNTTVDDVTGTA